MIYQTLDTVFHPFSNTENRVKNKTHSGVILTNFYTPNANMADLSAGPGLVARKRG